MSNPNLNQKSTVTQKSLIKEYLLTGKHLTPLEALNMFSSMRLAAVIHTLKSEGLDIVTDIITTPTGKKVASYRLNDGYSLSSLHRCSNFRSDEGICWCELGIGMFKRKDDKSDCTCDKSMCMYRHDVKVLKLC